MSERLLEDVKVEARLSTLNGRLHEESAGMKKGGGWSGVVTCMHDAKPGSNLSPFAAARASF